MSRRTIYEAEVVLKSDTKEAQVQYDELEKKAKKLRKDLSNAIEFGDKREFERVSKDLNKVNKEMEAMRIRASNVSLALDNINHATPKELKKMLKELNAQLNSGAVRNGTDEWESYAERVRLVKTRLAELNKELAAVKEEAPAKNRNIFNDIFTGALYGIGANVVDKVSDMISSGIEQLTARQSSQANLKALTGLDDESVAWLTAQASKLATTMDETGLRVTQSSREILDAYMLVGSNKPELLSDAEALDAVTVEAMRLATAAKIDLGDAVTAMTTALNQYGAGANEAAKYVNVLAAGSKAGAADVRQQAASILNAGTAAASAGVPLESLVGCIEMLGEKGIKAEAAGTGLKTFFLKLSTGASDTNPKVVGLAQALETLKAKVEAAEKASPGGGAGLLKKMFGDGGYSVASVLTDNIAKVDDYTRAVTGTSVALEQAAINSDTAEARTAQLKAQLDEASMALADSLQPALEMSMAAGESMLSVLVSLIKFLGQYPATVFVAVAAVAAYTVAVNKAAIAQKLLDLRNGKVVASLKAVRAALLANPWAAAAAAIAVVVGLLVDFSRRSRDAAAASREMMKAYTDTSAATADYAAKEKAALDQLYNAATDEALAKKERAAAARELLRLYPDQFRDMTTEQIMLGQAKTAYDNVTESILANARARAASSKIEANTKELLDVEMELAEAAKKKEAADKKREAYKPAMATGTVMYNSQYSSMTTLNETKVLKKESEALALSITELTAKKTALTEANKQLAAVVASATVTPAVTPGQDGGGGGGSSSKTDPAKALKAELEERKKLRAQDEAETMLARSMGLIDLKEARAKERKIEEDYVEDVIKIHERHSGVDLPGYAAALKQRETLQAQSLERMQAQAAAQAEAAHHERTATLQAQFYDQRSVLFNNERALHEALLQEDVNYLLDKAQLYADGSRERLDIEREVDDLIKADQLEKQKETADLFRQYSSEYARAEAAERRARERQLLQELHEQGLLSEKDYQNALASIKKDEREKDMAGRQRVQSQYGDMVVNLVNSFSKLFENIGKGGQGMWDSLADASQAAYAVMSTALQQFSAYSNACRDADLAKAEARYDREIKAAGKDEKKKEQLEKQKAAEIAKIKKKYNDRAMKMELAQAFAQTAMAAISAYASAAAVPVVGHILGPIAAGLATAAGMLQIATIKKQHEAQAAGYYSGGFTGRDPDNRREVGVVHANEFVANHQAVANPALAPVLRLIDTAQRTNTVGTLTAADVSNALGHGRGVASRAGAAHDTAALTALGESTATMAGVSARSAAALEQLNETLSQGIEARAVMDGEDGFYHRLRRYERLINPSQR